MILFAGANASGATVLSLDDPSVDTDQGSAFTASLTTSRFDAGKATSWAALRRLIQAVILANTATVVITPLADGSEYTSQASTNSLAATSGTEQSVEVPVFAMGTRFQMKVQVTAHAGLVELGEADQWYINQRPTRSR